MTELGDKVALITEGKEVQNMSNLSGKVVLITGGGSGVGAETALRFVKLGFKVVVVGRTLAKLEQVYQLCENKPNLLVVEGDYGNPQSRVDIVAKTVNHFGHLDVLVLSSGELKPNSVENVSVENMCHFMGLNIKGLALLTNDCLPYLQKTNGIILFTLELGSAPVTILDLSQGMVDTNVLSSIGLLEGYAYHIIQFINRKNSFGRKGTAEDLAKTITYLACEDLSCITAGALFVNGGVVLKIKAIDIPL